MSCELDSSPPILFSAHPITAIRIFAMLTKYRKMSLSLSTQTGPGILRNYNDATKTMESMGQQVLSILDCPVLSLFIARDTVLVCMERLPRSLWPILSHPQFQITPSLSCYRSYYTQIVTGWIPVKK